MEDIRVPKRSREEGEYLDVDAPQPPFKKKYWTLPFSNYIGPNDPALVGMEPSNRADALAREHDELYGFIQHLQEAGDIDEKMTLELERYADVYTANKANALWGPTPLEAIHAGALWAGLKYGKPIAERLGIISPGQYIIRKRAGGVDTYGTPERTPGKVRPPPKVQKVSGKELLPFSEPGFKGKKRLFEPVPMVIEAAPRRAPFIRPPLTFRKRRRLSKYYSYRRK